MWHGLIALGRWLGIILAQPLFGDNLKSVESNEPTTGQCSGGRLNLHYIPLIVTFISDNRVCVSLYLSPQLHGRQWAQQL